MDISPLAVASFGFVVGGLGGFFLGRRDRRRRFHHH